MKEQEYTGLDFLTDKSLRYALLYHFWLHKWSKKHFGFRKTTTMLLLMLYELKRPIISTEWNILNSSYSFSNSSADILVLEGKSMIRRTKVMISDIDKIKSRAGRKSVKGLQQQAIHAYRYEITPYGIQTADCIRHNINVRIQNFTIKETQSMRKY